MPRRHSHQPKERFIGRKNGSFYSLYNIKIIEQIVKKKKVHLAFNCVNGD